jgi:hypothetical protein
MCATLKPCKAYKVKLLRRLAGRFQRGMQVSLQGFASLDDKSGVG